VLGGAVRAQQTDRKFVRLIADEMPVPAKGVAVQMRLNHSVGVEREFHDAIHPAMNALDGADNREMTQVLVQKSLLAAAALKADRLEAMPVVVMAIAEAVHLVVIRVVR
jgi:hypothetical protein